MALSDYLIARVRRLPPTGACVVPGSTPVVAFGNARTADAPEETIAQLVAGCDSYFQRNPYWLVVPPA
jgi:hypothetical protein